MIAVPKMIIDHHVSKAENEEIDDCTDLLHAVDAATFKFDNNWCTKTNALHGNLDITDLTGSDIFKELEY